PTIALPCADALTVLPEYGVELPDETVEALRIETPEEVRVLLVLQHWNDAERMMLSTRGPIIVNTRTGLAQQLIV
ncbi:MAG: flagellar assembly protein FliW, partial [Anaerolineae bacterium]|nr:flagellar assembly protein FliW [Anaerolineae bacterium]